MRPWSAAAWVSFRPMPATAVVLEDIGHVLQDEVSRPLDAQDVVHLEEEIALIGVLEALLVSCFRERLTRKTRGKDVVIGHALGDDFVAAQIVKVTPSVDTEVDLVEGLQRGLPLSSEHGTSLQLIEGDVEATQSSEEVDEAEGLITSSHHFGPVSPRLIGRDFSWFVQMLRSHAILGF